MNIIYDGSHYRAYERSVLVRITDSRKQMHQFAGAEVAVAAAESDYEWRVLSEQERGLTPLRRICERLRARLDADEQWSSAGACLGTSVLLRDVLRAAGYSAELAVGCFHVDDPDPEDWEDVLFVDETEDENGVPVAAHEPIHYWVLVLLAGFTQARVYCDLTADQFDDGCNEPLLPVMLVGDDDPAAWRYTLAQLAPDYALAH